MAPPRSTTSCACSAGSALLLRVTIFIGLASVVTTIIYFTPVPNPYYASCDRPCHELDWPMICRYKMSLEMYESMGPACAANDSLQCAANESSRCLAAGCVHGDGSRRTLMTANRMLPGPTLRVCENDIVVVDVLNRAMGQAVAVHWGGQSQREFPHMDGVPQVTQCPINAHTTFQYKFRATAAGTHLWEATGSPQAAAVSGPLIVKQSDARDPQRHLFDEDVHVLTVSTFGSALLVNGHVEHQSAALVRGRRYRLRLLHSAGGVPEADTLGSASSAPPAWPVTVAVDGLALLVVAVDGHPVRPRSTRSLSLWPGERADVVVSADEPPPESSPSYRLRVAQQASTPTLASARVELPFKDLDPGHKGRFPASVLKEAALDGDVMGVADALDSTDLEGLDALPEELADDAIDVRLYLPFDYQPLAGLRSDLSGPQPPAKPGSSPAPPAPSDAPWPRSVPRLCNISMALPAAPLLTQPRDAEAWARDEHGGHGGVPLCRGDARPAACPAGRPGADQQSCECTHVIRVPLGSAVEIVLADQGGDGSGAHVFQLHGHSFWVVGRGAAGHRGPGVQRGSWEALAAADRDGALLKRHLAKPVRKDTVAVPPLGAVAVRLVADNPGYWLLREQSFFRWPAGLGVVLQVGDEADMPATPSDFPRCGSFIGPEFFLM